MKSLTVLQNVMLGGYHHSRMSLLRAPFLPVSRRSEETMQQREAMALLERLQLDHLHDERIDGLPYPTLKRVELARALASRPTFLMLDEPAGGLSHSEVDELARTLVRVREEFNLTLLLVEHHMGMVMNISTTSSCLTSATRSPRAARPTSRRIRASFKPIWGSGVNVLEIKGVSAGYGRVAVLQDISLAVGENSIAVLLGANGAGKTTTLRAISGMIKYSGQVLLDGRDLKGLGPDQVARLGIAHGLQGRGTFTDLTVEENLAVGAYRRSDKAQIAADIEEMYALFPRLRERRKQKAGSLSGGEQQMLAVGRALMLKPRVMLLDEPSLGLAPVIIDNLYEALQRVNQSQGTAMLIVEQNANLALEIANEAYVLETGSMVLSGAARDVAENDGVRAAYLGH